MRLSIVMGGLALATVFGSAPAHGGDVATALATMAEPGMAGPCAGFVKAVCAKSGESSTTCAEVKRVSAILPPLACKAASSDTKYALVRLDASRKPCNKLVADLCRDLGEQTSTCKMVQTHTKEFPAERCTTMLDRYAEVVADLKKMEEANKPLDAAKQKAIAASDAPAFGPATAKVTLVEFADFQCPFSAKASRVVQAIKAKYGTQVRFVYRNYPLAFHNNARPAAEAALAAHAQGKFWEFHDKLFENQSSLDRAALEKYAQQIGLDMTLFRKALVTKQFASKVAADMKLGGQVAVQGTPTLYLNGRRVQNPTAEAEVFKLIDEALSGK